MEDLVARIGRLAGALPGVETGTSYGGPALKVGGRAFAAVKRADLLVLMVPLDEKERLMEMAPEIYFQTDHYKGWPAVLVHAARIDDAELALRLEEAWHRRASAKLRKLRG
ncbi:MmcQ/YjbR family DNA-binding protein [Rhizobium sp. TRM95111]|uniref:MmcQ/YjbR family DNA-binding protein n=1 Tax=Rhizobium alarense TaxID=2846851 RepID=UPI001F224B1F|nr:MmcQ/YjbR family DNA-binding protein [Rhizobium alarense]MCF3638526.1 MmcQ/YjbR family DNA-binding protein [Rhizobium alarense]